MNIDSLLTEIRSAEPTLRGEHKHIWELISIFPARWRISAFPVTDEEAWVVGIFGERVLWYNDIEEGFNISRYSEFGTIDEYWANQDGLPEALERIRSMIYWGGPPQGQCGPPTQSA
ncbi:MAG: hypothetical protein JNM27_03460 [Leptospirales bacterium]|nr:hypothetical protein [Leptospirales bacterium]